MNDLPEINFKLLFESIPGLYLVLIPDEKFTIVEVSNAYLNATMTQRREIVGKGLFEVFPDNPDDDAATGTSNLRSSINHALKYKTTHSMDLQKYDIRKPNGEFEVRYWSPLNTPVFNAAGEVIYIVHRADDVTEFVQLKSRQSAGSLEEQLRLTELELFKRSKETQKINAELQEQIRQVSESEDKFFKVFYASPAGITIVDSSGRWKNVNESFLRMIGYSLEEVIGKNSGDINMMDAEERKKILDVIYNEGKVRNRELTFRKKSGEKRIALFSSEQVVINGAPSIISILYDITDRKNSEEEIKQTNLGLEEMIRERTQHLEQANATIQKNLEFISSQNKQLEDFCNIISHNLRGPLVNISMLVGFITQSTDAEEQKMFTKELGKSSTLLNEVFDELVESLQVREDTTIRSEQLNLSSVLKKIMNGLQGQIKEVGANIAVDFKDAPEVQYPSKYLSSIFYNLLSNALKYHSPDRVPEIMFRSQKKEGAVLLSVSDNGLGLDLKKHSENLFKIRKVFHPHPDSKGFGLFITRTQVEAMGGKIWMESTPGQGSTFFIELKNQNI